MGFHQMLDDGQAQAGSRNLVRTVFVAAVKTFKNAR